jgi:L-cystine uptake protein TcyP (sodium:dicarboxylate symporter family)
MKKTFEVLAFAFTSRSSAGSLPLNIQTIFTCATGATMIASIAG